MVALTCKAVASSSSFAFAFDFKKLFFYLISSRSCSLLRVLFLMFFLGEGIWSTRNPDCQQNVFVFSVCSRRSLAALPRPTAHGNCHLQTSFVEPCCPFPAQKNSGFARFPIIEYSHFATCLEGLATVEAHKRDQTTGWCGSKVMIGMTL